MKRPRFVIETAVDARTYWRLVAANGETLATSETFETRQACEKSIGAARRAVLTARSS